MFVLAAASATPPAAAGLAQRARAAAAAPDPAQIAQPQATDREVRQHEAAHLAAGAGLVTSGAHFTLVQGPDGRSYAVAGEVGISTAEGRTPQDTLARAEQIRSAALAPAQPSAQDHAVAAAAMQMALMAQLQLAQQRGAQQGDGSANPPASNGEGQGSTLNTAQHRAGVRAYQGASSLLPPAPGRQLFEHA